LHEGYDNIKQLLQTEAAHEIRNEYIWGVELIYALKSGGQGTALPIVQLDISEEMTYF